MGLWTPAIGSLRALVHPGGAEIYARRPRTSGFSPTDISGLQGWWDASDISTLWQDSGRTTAVTTNGQTVGAWDDKSGNGWHATQGTGANEPTYATAQINGLSALDFDGSDDRLDAGSVSVSQPNTWFLVVDSDQAAADMKVVDGTTTRQAVYTYAAGGKYAHYAAGSEVGSSVSVDTSPHIIVSTMNGASSKLRIDGGADTSGGGNPGAASIVGLRIGAETSAIQFWDGRIAEIILYDSALSTSDLDLVGDYLAAKWGITWTPAS